MQSPVVERLVGGVVLVGLLLILALVIGPREGVQMPVRGDSQVSVATDAPEPAGYGADAFPGETSNNDGEPEATAEWIPSSSVSSSRITDSDAQSSAAAPGSSATKAMDVPEASGSGERTAAATGPADQWGVQIGSFAARANAQRLSEWCRGEGYGVKIVTLQRTVQTLYRVRVGPYATRADARAAVAELALLGRKGFVAEWEDSSP